jgi:hypothetical protein
MERNGRCVAAARKFPDQLGSTGGQRRDKQHRDCKYSAYAHHLIGSCTGIP